MKKCRVYKDGDNIWIDWPSDFYQTPETWNQCKENPSIAGFQRKDLTESDIPKGVSIEQMYPDFEENGEPYIKVDHDWSIKMMPDILIKKKREEKLKDEIKSEISKDSPDPLLVVKKRQELDESKENIANKGYNESVYWAEKALEGLDARVKGGEPDKPVIRKKLQDKLQELKSKEGK